MTNARTLLGREAWVEAAIEQLASRGFRGLAVEPLARMIGISKGSFYWHFENLDDLVRAVVQTWKAKALDQVIEQLRSVTDPRQRLAVLIHSAWGEPRHLRAEAALLAAALSGDRRVTRVVKQVTNQRLAYLRTVYRGLGLTAADAGRWALTTYSAYVGTMQLMALEPRSLATRAAVRAHAQHLERVLIPPR